MADAYVIELDGLRHLIEALLAAGYQVIGPQLQDGAVVYAPLENAAQLPVGQVDEQEGGHYRLRPAGDASLFRYAVGPHSWKRYLFPPQQVLWRALRQDQGFRIKSAHPAQPAYAFIGVRACELAAMAIQDRVFQDGEHVDPGYGARRRAAFIVAVNCTRAAATCFCASTGTGPAVRSGYDLALTELLDADGHRFVLETGSARGQETLSELPHRPARAEEIETARARVERSREDMGRKLPADTPDRLKQGQNHPHWSDVAGRCLSCGNCTLVCPTCFCSGVEDHTSLDGSEAWRTRRWNSCFSVDFSHIHGGPIRHDGGARYRQWISHKLAWWWDQFGTSGCTGCGRCITWCPVGIDITAEVAALESDANGEP